MYIYTDICVYVYTSKRSSSSPGQQLITIIKTTDKEQFNGKDLIESEHRLCGI